MLADGFCCKASKQTQFQFNKAIDPNSLFRWKKKKQVLFTIPTNLLLSVFQAEVILFRNSALPCVSLVQGLASLPSKTLAHPCKSSSTLPFPLHHLLPHIISSSFPSEWNPDSCSLLCIHGLPSVCLASFTCPPLHMILCFLCQTPCSSSPTPAKE